MESTKKKNYVWLIVALAIGLLIILGMKSNADMNSKYDKSQEIVNCIDRGNSPDFCKNGY
jgi:Tfp pilus assembly protein PilW